MRILLYALATLAALLMMTPIVNAQEAVEEIPQLNAADSEGEAVRRARLKELGQLTQERRQQRRQQIRQQLESLSDEQRQAIRDRRRMQVGAKAGSGRKGRPQGIRRRPQAPQQGAIAVEAETEEPQQDQ